MEQRELEIRFNLLSMSTELFKQIDSKNFNDYIEIYNTLLKILINQPKNEDTKKIDKK